MNCSVSFEISPFVTATTCVLRLAAGISALQSAAASPPTPSSPPAGPWELRSFFYFLSCFSSSFFFPFFPTSGSPNPKLKVNRCCWPPSSIPGCASKDLECQRQRGGKGEACAWVKAPGRRRTEQNTTSSGLPLSKPVFVPDLCFRVSLKACSSARLRQRARSSARE